MGHRDFYNGFEIEDGAFVSAEGETEKKVMPEGATLVRYNGNEERVIIPQGISYIDSDAFENNCDIKSVVIPDSVKVICSYAFYGCKNLKSVSIPNTVTRICSGAFTGTPWLEELKRESGTSSAVVNGIWIEPDSSDFGYEDYEYVIPEGVKKIPSMSIINDERVDYCKDEMPILYVSIPKSVLQIAGDAFGFKNGIVIKGYHDSYAEYYAQRHHLPFKELVAHPSDDPVLNWELDGDGNLQVFGRGKMPDFANGLKPPWHERCKEISKVVIHVGITSIGRCSFKDCTELKSAEIPISVTEIGKEAFFNCGKLSSVLIPSSVVCIDDDAFYGCESLADVYLPPGLLRLGRGAFGECFKLSSINIPENLAEIEEETFYACSALTHITIPDTISYIGSKAFCGSGLIEITLPKCITTIYELTFAYCLKLRKAVLPRKFKHHMNEIKEIKEMAFFNCTQLNAIEIPHDTEYIEQGAFAACESLTSIVIPNTVKRIDNTAFYKCTKLQTVTFQFYTPGCTHIWRIGKDAFAECSALQSITIPGSVQQIDSGAFSDCISLRDVHFSPQTQIGENAFANTPFEKNN